MGIRQAIKVARPQLAQGKVWAMTGIGWIPVSEAQALANGWRVLR